MHKKDLPSDVLLQKISESEANKLVDEVVKSRKQELIRGTLRSKIGSARLSHKNAGLNRLDEGTKICDEIGVTPRKVLEFKNPKEAICEVAEKLVVGSHGKGALQRYGFSTSFGSIK
ncbi:predicted protein [Arabidopsis lyrata subsp. lyrata]|uniref:Predicted protein n=2 Tax=Arabidopsis lyrata subsp. lyrata TaxID=81972 RepID=D7MW94_ARALL|nr:predicted protein [Arabidopsis lyrata subsp. lyrata]